MISLRNSSASLQRSLKEVDGSVKRGVFLSYAQLRRMFMTLDIREKSQLVDYIIKKYSVIRYDILVTKCYDGYSNMLTAINSNTGSEHDIMEHSYCKTDTPYREMMVILKREGITDIRSVITWSDEDKKHIASLLKSRTSATHRQIRKFLHLKQ